MKVAFWCIGRTDETWLTEGMSPYLSRLNHYLSFEYREITLARGRKTADAALMRQAEKEEIMKLLKPNDLLVLLDERGKTYSSESFAQFLQKKFNEAGGNLIFLAGGAYGFQQEIYDRANARLSLSLMTFTHQMVRLIFLEQLYRAMTILRNEPYHH